MPPPHTDYLRDRAWRTIERYAANPTLPVDADLLCREAGVCARTLYNICRAFSGQSPMAYIKRCRMTLAHAMLHRAAPDATVTGIATLCGFSHFGRFSVRYRQLYGQPPSQALRQQARCSAAQPRDDAIICIMAVEAALAQNDAMKRILDSVKVYTPWPIRRMTRRIKRRARWKHYARQPVAAVFGEVYERNLWGGAQGTFYSGPGSESHAATAYAEGIRSFIASRKIKSIVDLGCGDFRIASRLLPDDVSYVGVDIVEPLVRQNTAFYHSDKVSFACLDIIDDELPDGELCLIREVFQHLSNAQILKVIPKLRRFKYAVYTDHQSAPGVPCTPNRDISHGVDIRLWLGSALFLDQPPFNVPTGPLFEAPATVDLCGPGEQLRTYLMWP